MRIPVVILYGAVAINISMTALSMQFDIPADWHVSPITKGIVWALAVGAWALAWKNRAKVIKLF